MFSRVDRSRGPLHLAYAAVLLLLVPTCLYAQAPPPEAGVVRTAVSDGAETDNATLNLLVGRSALVNIGQPIARISLTRPEIADAVVTGTQQILVHGKSAGTISMFVWDRSGGIKRYEVTVGRDLSQLSDQLKQLFPGETIAVNGTGKNVVVSGSVSSKYVIEKAAEVAAGYVEKKEDVVNLLRQQEGIATNQVLLRVRFAEVSRSALTELGVSLFSDGYKNQLGRSTTQQFQAPFFDQQKPMVGQHLVFSDYLNLFLFDQKNMLGATVRLLQTRGLLQSLAEPNLIAENGKEASFLAGGEYPYPVVQGTGSNLAVTILFKEYGIRLNFTPTLMGGDLINLKVRPEVSTLDFNNAVTYQGFRIPSLTTRRAETEIELQDGQTFAIAGLLNNSVTSSLQKIPGIGDIPILGYLFRSKAAQKEQTELVVMITPQILRRGSMGAAEGLPNFAQPFLGPMKKTVPPPAPRLPGSGKTGDEPRPEANTSAATSAPPGPTAAPAAAAPAVAAQPATAPTKVVPSSQPVKKAVPVQPPGVLPATTSAAARPVASDISSATVASPAAPVPPAQAAAPASPTAEKSTEQAKAEEKARQRAEKELRAQQEKSGRELAEQQALEAKRKEADAKKAEEQRKADARLAEQQRKAEAKAAAEALKVEQRNLELAKKQAAEAKKEEERLAQERAKRDAEAAKQQAALKKQTDEDKKRAKEFQEAQERLKAAEAAYLAALDRAKKTGGQ